MSGAIPPLPLHAIVAWYLVKHRDFTFYLYNRGPNVALSFLAYTTIPRAKEK
jgi:hypothetical protein